MDFLKIDSPFMKFLGTMADLMILNMLTVLCCVPIVTAGASFTAMHYVLQKLVRGEENYVSRQFFHSFKENFVQSTIIWIGMVVVYGALFVDWRILRMQGDQFPGFLIILLYGAAVIIFLYTLYIFPILARYKNTIRGILKLAFAMTIMGSITLRTLAAGILYIVPFAILLIYGWGSIPILLLMGFTVPGFFRAMMYRGLFNKYETREEV
ncbi:MAG: YesL family protein [Lachnospiraceae bacterium]|nr:YesL family protein [Lachnospiraceae bacterium]MEE1110493.1 YesL family protein [Lachnospiraceae bacterium]MEE3376906.1 YesL family protein [Lachnospiraceae bacterium]MEE3436891.1 YesL family protein [Lachnospiraceae bacterium]MEE3458002.1 YesL family protein [Lachnospiraceae bacterium]